MKKTGLTMVAILLFTACNNNQEAFKEVKIGGQVWMTQNLNVERFCNGDTIQEAITEKQWVNASKNRQPAWCHYDNDAQHGVKYGKLYNWYAVNDPRGLAPKGWRIPSEEDWSMLTEFTGDVNPRFPSTSFNSGNKLNASSGWMNDGNGNNESGFSALPAGIRNHIVPYEDSSFGDMGYVAYFWSSSNAAEDEWTTYFADGSPRQARGIAFLDSDVGRINVYKGLGLSVRCIKN